MEIVIVVGAIFIGIMITVVIITNNKIQVNCKKVEYSNDILLELSIKQGLGNRNEVIPYIIKIYKNRNTELIINDNVICTYFLDEVKYNNLINNINLDKINNMSIKSNFNIKNGFEFFIVLFDKNNNTINRIGGYEPDNEEFNCYKELILDCFPSEFIKEKRNNYIEKLNNNNLLK